MSPKFRYAGFWVRLLADMVDSTLLTVVSWAIEAVLLAGYIAFGRVFLGWTGEWVDLFYSLDGFWIQILNVGLYLGLSTFYYVWGTFRYGTTFGKRIFRIVVRSYPDAGPVTLKASLIRYLGYIASALPLGGGYTMAGFHPEKRALHDLMAGTFSILDPRSNLPE